jgi:hypothetical protein
MLGKMDKHPTDEGSRNVSTTPFDDFPEDEGGLGKRTLHLAPIAPALRIICAIALAFSFASAAGILVLDVLHRLRPDLSWRVKSAIPLIGIGISNALLQFTLPRTRKEFFLSLAVSLAFVLWGFEQFIPVPRLASLVDDFVVFLFVLDLAVVIKGQLKQSIRRGLK